MARAGLPGAAAGGRGAGPAATVAVPQALGKADAPGRGRGEIAVYFRVLQGGGRVEALPFAALERFAACWALYRIVAWRVRYGLRRGRAFPEIRCAVVLTGADWKAVYQIVTSRRPPSQPPALGAMVNRSAEWGGYLGRTHDGPPGPKVLWIGLQWLRAFALAWATFSPDPTRRKDV